MIRTLLRGFWICSGALFSAGSGLPRDRYLPSPHLPSLNLPSQGRTRCGGWRQQDQGIEGTVYQVSGNQMPAPGHKRPPLQGVRSTLYIFELTNIRQVTRQDQSPYYSAIQTRLIKEVGTDSLGHFRAVLPAGHYSLFTRKNGSYYASRYDTENNIAPVEVVPGKMTKVDCKTEGDRRPVY